MFRRSTFLAVALCYFCLALNATSFGQGFWYPGSGGACQNCGSSARSAMTAPAYSTYSAPVVATQVPTGYQVGQPWSNAVPYTAQPMQPVIVSYKAVIVQPGMAQWQPGTVVTEPFIQPQSLPPFIHDIAGSTVIAVQPWPGTDSGIPVDPALGVAPPKLVEVVEETALPSVDSVVPSGLADANPSPSDLPTGNSLNSESSDSAQPTKVQAEPNTELEQLKLELTASLDRVRQADERVYAAEKAAQAAEATLQQKQELLNQQVVQLEAKLAQANTSQTEQAEQTAALTKQLESSKALMQENKRLQEELNAARQQAEAMAKSQKSDAQSLENKLKTMEQRLAKIQAEKQALSNQLKKAAEKPRSQPGKPEPSKPKSGKPESGKPESDKPESDKSEPNQTKGEPQLPKRPAGQPNNRPGRRNDQATRVKPETKESDNKADSAAAKDQADSEKLELLKEKMRLLEETMGVKLNQSKTRITKRIADQKRRLLDSGLKRDDSKIVDLEKKLQAELNNSSNKIRAEHASKIEQIQSEIDKIKKSERRK